MLFGQIRISINKKHINKKSTSVQDERKHQRRQGLFPPVCRWFLPSDALWKAGRWIWRKTDTEYFHRFRISRGNKSGEKYRPVWKRTPDWFSSAALCILIIQRWISSRIFENKTPWLQSLSLFRKNEYTDNTADMSIYWKWNRTAPFFSLSIHGSSSQRQGNPIGHIHWKKW